MGVIFKHHIPSARQSLWPDFYERIPREIRLIALRHHIQPDESAPAHDNTKTEL
jgi:hypothetical protein